MEQSLWDGAKCVDWIWTANFSFGFFFIFCSCETLLEHVKGIMSINWIYLLRIITNFDEDKHEEFNYPNV